MLTHDNEVRWEHDGRSRRTTRHTVPVRLDDEARRQEEPVMTSAQHPAITLDLATSVVAERRRAERSRAQRVAVRAALRDRR